jgi:fermentation-respiration switch protein FrsA (DUF1100 family)
MVGSRLGWIVAIAVVGAGMFVLAVVVRAMEAEMAFFPSPGEDATPASYGLPYSPLTLATSDGERLRVWHLQRADARAQILYFHGNGGNLSVWADILVGLWRRGFDVIAVDYRGYGRSTGRPSEAGLYRDVDAAVGLVHGRVRLANRPLLYWGRSLGATMAAYAASTRAPEGVVLEAGFPSVRSVLEGNPLMWMLSWLSSYRFPTAEWMRSVKAPTLVIHGDADSVIPFRLGQRLHDGITGPKQFVTIRGGDHNDAIPPDAAAYWKAVDDFLEMVISSSAPR